MKKTGCSWLMNRGQCSTAIAGTIESFSCPVRVLQQQQQRKRGLCIPCTLSPSLSFFLSLSLSLSVCLSLFISLVCLLSVTVSLSSADTCCWCWCTAWVSKQIKTSSLCFLNEILVFISSTAEVTEVTKTVTCNQIFTFLFMFRFFYINPQRKRQYKLFPLEGRKLNINVVVNGPQASTHRTVVLKCKVGQPSHIPLIDWLRVFLPAVLRFWEIMNI